MRRLNVALKAIYSQLLDDLQQHSKKAMLKIDSNEAWNSSIQIKGYNPSFMSVFASKQHKAYWKQHDVSFC